MPSQASGSAASNYFIGHGELEIRQSPSQQATWPLSQSVG
jgi:hypothetical protein